MSGRGEVRGPGASGIRTTDGARYAAITDRGIVLGDLATAPDLP